MKLVEIAANPNTPGDALAALTEHEDKFVRKAIAANPSTLVGTLFKLVRDPSAVVREELASNPNLSENAQTHLAADKVPSVRNALLANPSISQGVLEILANDEESEIRVSVANHPQTSSELLQKMAKDASTEVVAWVARRTDSQELIEEFAHSQTRVSAYEFLDEVTLIREFVALNPHCSIEILKLLAQDPSESVRESLLKEREFCPIEILEILSKDESSKVLSQVAGNKSTPVAMLESLVSDAIKALNSRATRKQAKTGVTSLVAEASSILEAAASNPNSPIQLLRKIMKAGNQNYYPHNEIVSNPNCPPEILEELWAEPYGRVQDLIAIHPNTPPHILLRFAETGQCRGLEYLDNPNTPAEAFEVLAKGGTDWNRRQVATHQSTPIHLLVLLSKDIEMVRQAVASNSNAMTVILKKLSNDESELVRTAVAENPNTPVSILEKFSTDPSLNVRLALTRNPKTPPEILIELADVDEDEAEDLYVERELILEITFKQIVSISANGVALNPNTPPEFLSRFIWEIVANERTPSIEPSSEESPTNYSDEEMLKLAENPETSTKRLHLILESDIDVFENHEIVILSALARHPNLSTKDLFNILGFAVGHGCQEDRQICEVNLQSEVIRNLDSKEIEVKDYKRFSKDEDWRIREGVAAYTKTPSEVLKKLVENEEFDESVVFNVAMNPNSDLATLLMIEDQEVFFNEDHQWIYEGLAQNPNSPEDLLLRLANDEYFRDGKDTFRETIAHNKGASLAMLYFLLSGENRDVEERVRANLNFRKVTKTELMEFPFFARKEIAGSSSIDSEYLEMLLEDPSFEIQERLLLNPRVLDEKLNDWQKRAREYLLQIDRAVRSSEDDNPSKIEPGGLSAIELSDETFPVLLTWVGHEEWYYGILLKFDSPTEFLFLAATIASNQTHFLKIESRVVQRLLLNGIQLKLEREELAVTSKERLDMLGSLEIRREWVISVFARNPLTSQSTLEKLAKSQDEDVIYNLAENPSVQTDVLDILVKRNIEHLNNETIAFALYLIALNPRLSKQSLKLLSEVDDMVILDAVAENPSTNQEILDSLLIQNDLNLRLRVLDRLENNNESVKEMYTQILQNSNSEQLARLARYSKLPLEVQKRLCEKRDVEVMRCLAKNPGLDSELQIMLAKDRSVEVKIHLAFNPSCTLETRSVLTEDKSEDIRFWATFFGLQTDYYHLCERIKSGEI